MRYNVIVTEKAELNRAFVNQSLSSRGFLFGYILYKV